MAEAVEAILEETGTAAWITVTIEERTEETYRQQRRGRPGADTLYVKHERKRFELTHRVELERLDEEARCDGIFPLISNEPGMSAKDLLLAYKEQPMIEKRFGQLKTDFVVAPVYLEGGEPDPGVAVRVLPGAAGGVAAGAGVEAGDGARGDRERAAVPGGPGVPAADGAEGDRPVRGRAAA